MENVNWLKLKLNQKMIDLQTAKANINADLSSPAGNAKNLIQNTQNKIINHFQQQFVNPQQIRMNNLASIDRAVYVKNLLNLPKNMVELLVMVQNDGKMPNLQHLVKPENPPVTDAKSNINQPQPENKPQPQNPNIQSQEQPQNQKQPINNQVLNKPNSEQNQQNQQNLQNQQQVNSPQKQQIANKELFNQQMNEVQQNKLPNQNQQISQNVVQNNAVNKNNLPQNVQQPQAPQVQPQTPQVQPQKTRYNTNANIKK